MNDVLGYLHHINRVSTQEGYDRIEELMLGNTFSGFVSELLVKAIDRFCPTLTRNTRIGGHPDLLPLGTYVDDAVLHGAAGIEVKVSLSSGSWQGHNAEEAWIMVFQISVDRATMPVTDRTPMRFEKVMLARLQREHWSFSGRVGQSRRTPTASITALGTALLHASPLYERPGYARARRGAVSPARVQSGWGSVKSPG